MRNIVFLNDSKKNRGIYLTSVKNSELPKYDKPLACNGNKILLRLSILQWDQFASDVKP